MTFDLASEGLKKDFERLSDLVSEAQAYFRVHSALFAQDWHRDVVGYYYGFFKPVRWSIRFGFLLSLAKLFDTDSKSISVVTLKNRTINEMRKTGIEPCTHTVEITRLIRSTSNIRSRLSRYRNQVLAHADVSANPNISIQHYEFMKVFDASKEAVQLLSLCLFNRALSWSLLDSEATDSTRWLFNGLKNQIKIESGPFDFSSDTAL